tara:strand:- start:2583 stop:2912 length:330 start_codon:yes stop_codon:yes gene_type:complete
MDIALNSNIDLENKFENIRQLYRLINNIGNDNKRFILKNKFQNEIDFMIERIEECYYKYILKNKNEKKIKDETERIIYDSRKTIDAFMPYILLYNITENYKKDLQNSST